MAGRTKKMAAALAAVSHYLQEEEAAAAHAEQACAAKIDICGFNPWGYSGRQEMMAMRRLIQLRTFTRF